MRQITKKDLEAVVNRINLITKSPTESYAKLKNGTYKANIGNYHLDGAYGGWCLHRMQNLGGGISTPIGSGYYTKRELYEKMQAYICGLYDGGGK